MTIVFLLEERSAKYLLDEILPRLLPEEVDWKTIPHEGKSDLVKSIPHKLAAWKAPDTKFVVIHDQDANDCRQLKESIRELCKKCDKEVLIRIACRELEAWYFGDLKAVSKAYGKDFTQLSAKRKYRNPDAIENPKQELRKLIPQHEQISGAKRIGPLMDLEHNTSKSFCVLIEGIRRFLDG